MINRGVFVNKMKLCSMWYRFANNQIRFEFHNHSNEGVSEVLAYDDSDIIGNMEFSHTQSGVVTTHAFLEPEYRGMGYGKQMYQFAWNHLKSLGVSVIHSDQKVRTDARRVYESLMENSDWDVQKNSDNPSIYQINI